MVSQLKRLFLVYLLQRKLVHLTTLLNKNAQWELVIMKISFLTHGLSATLPTTQFLHGLVMIIRMNKVAVLTLPNKNIQDLFITT